MNYTNYKDSIVQGHRVKIIGWPATIPFASPSTISNLNDMRTLHNGWMSGSIRWVRMSTAEIKEHAQDLEQHHDEGQTIGKKHKRWTTKKKVPLASNDIDAENQANKEISAALKSPKAAKRAKRTRNSRMPPKSKDVITNSDSQEDEDDGE
jgi:hypothetical protein